MTKQLDKTHLTVVIRATRELDEDTNKLTAPKVRTRIDYEIEDPETNMRQNRSMEGNLTATQTTAALKFMADMQKQVVAEESIVEPA